MSETSKIAQHLSLGSPMVLLSLRLPLLWEWQPFGAMTWGQSIRSSLGFLAPTAFTVYGETAPPRVLEDSYRMAWPTPSPWKHERM